MRSKPSRARANQTKPVRDPDVEDAQVVSTPTLAVPPPSPPDAPSDVPMPTIENEPNSVYVPQSGCSIVDNFEILMMYMLYLTGNQLNFAPGVLRSIELPADRVAQLSAQAQRHMRQVAAGPAAE